jgi:hypothetical protein
MVTNPAQDEVLSTVENTDAVLIDSVVESDTPAMPEVQDHAIEAMRSRLEEETEKTEAPQSGGTTNTGPVKGQTDSDGRSFDPAIHETPLRINSDGFIAKRRGRVGGKTGAPNRSFVSQESPQTKKPDNSKSVEKAGQVASEKEAQFKAAGDTSAALFETVGILVLGDEFRPENTKEHDAMALSFEAYYRAKGCPDLPPGLVLACSLVIYTARRWNAPKIAEKRASIWGSIKRWWNDFKFRRSQK